MSVIAAKLVLVLEEEDMVAEEAVAILEMEVMAPSVAVVPIRLEVLSVVVVPPGGLGSRFFSHGCRRDRKSVV